MHGKTTIKKTHFLFIYLKLHGANNNVTFFGFVPYGNNFCFRMNIPQRQLDVSQGGSSREGEEFKTLSLQKYNEILNKYGNT